VFLAVSAVVLVDGHGQRLTEKSVLAIRLTTYQTERKEKREKPSSGQLERSILVVEVV
jgi:hypothetical protein